MSRDPRPLAVCGHVVHELRNPLAALLGFTELLRDERLGALPPSARDAVRDVFSCASEMRLVLDCVSDLAHQAQGRLEWRPRPIEGEELARLLSAQHLDAMRHDGRSARTELEGMTTDLFVDVERLSRAAWALGRALARATNDVELVLRLTARGGSHLELAVRAAHVLLPRALIDDLVRDFTSVDEALERALPGASLLLPVACVTATIAGGHAEARPSGEAGLELALSVPARAP